MVIIFAISTNIKPGHCTLKSNTMLYQIYLKKKKLTKPQKLKNVVKMQLQVKRSAKKIKHTYTPETFFEVRFLLKPLIAWRIDQLVPESTMESLV